LQDTIKKILCIEKQIQKKQESNKIVYYNKGQKIHKKQLAFAQCPKRNRWVFGGNRSGKTECGAVETVWYARGIHPYRPNKPNCSGWVVSLSRAMSRDVAQQKILQYLPAEWIDTVVMASGSSESPANGMIDFMTVKNVFGGLSRIGFKSCEMGREKFQGTSLDFVWFDEEPPKDIYDECKMRVLDKKGDIWGTMTPLLGLTWVYDTIYLNSANDPQVYAIQMEWADNPFLDKEEIQAFDDSLSSEELESRRYGKFRTSVGLVYPEFCESVHCIEPFCVPKEWYHSLSIDPGLNNPLSCHWYAVDGDGVVYVMAEHYKAKTDIATHAQAIQEICVALDWHCGTGGRYEALIDSAATQRTLASSKSVVDLFFEFGIATNPRVNKDMYSGISTVKQYLNPKNPKLYIFKSCTQLIREIKSYWWGQGDTPKKKDDHALDELRYFLMSLQNTPSAGKKVTQSLVQRHKNKLAKKRPG